MTRAERSFGALRVIGTDAVRSSWSRGPSREVHDAVQASFLARLPERVQAELLQSAYECELSASEVLEPRAVDTRARAEEAPCALVVSGLMRSYIMFGARQMTLRYLGPGMVVGIPGAIANVPAVDAQAVSDVRLLRLRTAVLVGSAKREAAVSWELARFLSECIFECMEVMSDNVFLPVRGRVARHLLDLAAREDGRVVVHASAQDIADATGTVREVVSRVMKQLRLEGLVARDGDLLVLRDLGALHAISSGKGNVAASCA